MLLRKLNACVMKYTIRIETNIPPGGVKDVDLFMSEISAKYGHKPENLLILVKILTNLPDYYVFLC